MPEFKFLEDLYCAAKGSVHIAALLNINQFTVDRWVKTGIPVKYWSILIDKYGITPAELYCITSKAKKRSK